MFVYTALILLCLLFSLINGLKNNKFILYPLLIIMLFLAVFRDSSIGTDTEAYIDLFNYSKNIKGGLFESGEYLFGYITYFCSNYLNLTCYYTIIYGIYLFAVGCFIKNFSTNWGLSIFIFITCGFYTQSFNIMRQFWALGVSLIGVYYLINKQPSKFWLYLIISTFIHGSAAILSILFFIRNIEFKKNIQCLIVTISFILGYFLAPILSPYFELLSVYTGRFEHYLLVGPSEDARNIISNIGLNIMFLFTLYYANQQYKNSVVLKMYFISIVVFNLFATFGFIIRLNEYFAIAQIVVLPYVLSSIRKTISKVVYVTLLLGYCLARFYMRTLNVDDIYPYILSI